MYELILWTEDHYKPGGEKRTVCLGIALAGSDVPTELIGRFGLARHEFKRGDRPEYRFFYSDRRPRLPIMRDGQLSWARWGNGRGQSRKLPRTGWTWQTTIEDGWWKGTDAEQVSIPATFAFDGRGVWYKVHVGIRGLLVPDERHMAVVYVICEPATHYYNIMTGSHRMPQLIGQRI
jgi:hypothetical protein